MLELDQKELFYCWVCKQKMPRSSFYLANTKKSKISTECIKCCSVRAKIRYAKNKHKEREDKLKRNYGLTINDFNVLLKNQNYGCKLCGKEHTELNKLHVDHYHSSNKVRGLLCKECNTGLGAFKDRIEVLKLAIKYLTNGVII